MLNTDFLLATVRVAGILALVSLGFNLMYGVLRFLNLAHGEVVVLGALIVERLSHHVDFISAVSLGSLITATLGVLIGRILFQPLRFQPRGSMLATSLGLSILLQVGISTYNKQASINLRPANLMVGSWQLEWRSPILLAGIALFVTLLLEGWLTRTRFGKAVVVTAENPYLAEAWGLPVRWIYDSVFAVSFGLAALSGSLLAVHYSVSFGLAFKVLVWSFSAILLGGLGKPLGGVVASVLVALLWSLLGGLGLEPFVDSLLLLLCAVSYIFFPNGLLGQRVRLV